ncbi:cytochrome c [Candidatus Puniceispirillum sp.]|nr:cytochrome c [Candidatus Puniceispirillum sp.]
MKQLMIMTILILNILTFGDAIAHSDATGIVKERMDYFKASQSKLKKIRAHISNENYESIIPLANSIASWSARMSDYFPAGSDTKPSEASPKIWSDFEGFIAAAELNWKATVSLAKAAKRGDRTSVITAFRETAESCKSCHKTYRLK